MIVVCFSLRKTLGNEKDSVYANGLPVPLCYLPQTNISFQGHTIRMQMDSNRNSGEGWLFPAIYAIRDEYYDVLFI